MLEDFIEQWNGDDNVDLLRHNTSANTWSVEPVAKPGWSRHRRSEDGRHDSALRSAR